MAKALLGYLGSVPDQRLLEEVAHLRARVRKLQQELDEARADQALAALNLRVPDSPPAEFAERTLASASAPSR